MTAFRLCCFWSSKSVRSKRRGGAEHDEIISPLGSSGALCAFPDAEVQECPLGEGDQDRLVEHEGVVRNAGSQRRSSSGSDCSMRGRAEPRRRFVLVSGTHRGSSSSLTEPLMESCSIKEEEGPLTYGEESYTVGESSRWDCSSYPWTEASGKEARPSRFVNMDSESMSDFDNSLLFQGSSVAQEMEETGTESMSMNSGWSSIQESATTSDDAPPVTWFLQDRNQYPFGKSGSVSSDSSESLVLCYGGQGTELQDAINFALGDENELSENRSQMGANILAALRNMKASRGVLPDGFHEQPPRPRKMILCASQPQKTVHFEGPSGNERCGTSVRQDGRTFCIGRQDKVVTWFANPIQSEQSEEERGASVGTSIILPVPLQEEEQDTMNVLAPGTLDDCSAIGKELLLFLESAKLRGGSLTCEPVPSRSTPLPCPHESAAEMLETSCKMQDICGSSSSSSLASFKESKSVSSCGDCEPGSEEAEEMGYANPDILQGKKERSDAEILFDTACSTPDHGKKGVHDSAITVGSCRLDATGCSVSQLSDQQGMSWASSDTSGFVSLLPSLPSLTEEGGTKELEACANSRDSGFHVKELGSGSFEPSSFYDCAPDISSSETTNISITPKGAVSSLPDLNLGRVDSSGSTTQDAGDSLSALAKSWPGIPDMTPRSLERWRLDLKLIWMGEDDDDLVAEVRNGSSCVFSSPKMPPVPEEDEAGESADCTSPVNSPVHSPVPLPTSDIGDASQTREPNRSAMATDRIAGERTEGMEGAMGQGKERHGDVLDVVDRMLLQLKATTPRAEPSSARGNESQGCMAEVLQPVHTGVHASTAKVTTAGSNASRKKVILSGVKAQLEKLGTLVASNAACVSPKDPGTEPGRSIELEWAILQNVWKEVARLEKELMNSSSPRSCGHLQGCSECCHRGNSNAVSTDGRMNAKQKASASCKTGTWCILLHFLAC